MKRIVVLISGRGSNLQALHGACSAEHWPAVIAAVVGSRADAPGLAWATVRGLATEVVDRAGFADSNAFDDALATTIDRHRPDLVVLAGFMRILGETCVDRYAGRMLNVHPSLLPSFPGLHTHRRAIDAGCRIAGATVHFVTPTVDHGPIVIQGAVPVQADDDAQALAARVLEVEHRILPLAVRWFVSGRLAVQADGRVRQLDGAPQYLL